jgi:catechol 2,3-dioxygenase-like lactoylglutathione lyase family enzyme
MDQSVFLHHVGLHGEHKDKTMFFYQDVLGLELVKTFRLSKDLTREIFGMAEPVEVLAFQDDGIYIEIFLDKETPYPTYQHIGLSVENLTNLIQQCKQKNVNTFSVKKGEKILWFIKDYSGNLFEIKQKD